MSFIYIRICQVDQIINQDDDKELPLTKFLCHNYIPWRTYWEKPPFQKDYELHSVIDKLLYAVYIRKDLRKYIRWCITSNEAKKIICTISCSTVLRRIIIQLNIFCSRLFQSLLWGWSGMIFLLFFTTNFLLNWFLKVTEVL